MICLDIGNLLQIKCLSDTKENKIKARKDLSEIPSTITHDQLLLLVTKSHNETNYKAFLSLPEVNSKIEELAKLIKTNDYKFNNNKRCVNREGEEVPDSKKEPLTREEIF
jgi:hypothetical protein